MFLYIYMRMMCFLILLYISHYLIFIICTKFIITYNFNYNVKFLLQKIIFNVHAQFVTENVKMTCSIQPPTNPENVICDKIFFCCKTSYIGSYFRKQNNCKRPTYYTMITLFAKLWYSTKIENITIKITESFTSFHKWHCKLLHWSLQFFTCCEL